MNNVNNFSQDLQKQGARRGRWSSIRSVENSLNLLRWSSVRLSTRAILVVAVFLGVTIESRTFAGFTSLKTVREIASLRFPQVRTQTDEDDILTQYMPYLQFVISIGNEVDAKSTQGLVTGYQNLRKKSPSAAALFLKGLRYEMNQRVEISGWNAQALTSNSPEMRLLVARYLAIWAREADEHLFRTYSHQIANRRSE